MNTPYGLGLMPPKTRGNMAVEEIQILPHPRCSASTPPSAFRQVNLKNKFHPQPAPIVSAACPPAGTPVRIIRAPEGFVLRFWLGSFPDVSTPSLRGSICTPHHQPPPQIFNGSCRAPKKKCEHHGCAWIAGPRNTHTCFFLRGSDIHPFFRRFTDTHAIFFL